MQSAPALSVLHTPPPPPPSVWPLLQLPADCVHAEGSGVVVEEFCCAKQASWHGKSFGAHFWMHAFKSNEPMPAHVFAASSKKANGRAAS